MPTAWLVSLKLESIGLFFIVFGTILSALPTRWRVLGKAAFYFGFIFFSFDLISASLMPLQELPLAREALLRAGSPWLGVVAGVGAIEQHHDRVCDSARSAGHASRDGGNTNRHRS